MQSDDNYRVPIDLDKYPEDTDIVIAALQAKENQPKDGMSINEGMSLKAIADKTSLTKSKVRTRIKKLLKNDHLDVHVPYPNYGRGTKYYTMEKSTKRTAKALDLDENLLAEIPEEITRQDMVNVLHQLAQNEAKIRVMSVETGAIEHVAGTRSD